MILDLQNIIILEENMIQNSFKRSHRERFTKRDEDKLQGSLKLFKPTRGLEYDSNFPR
jgi:hypothetical protein